MDGEYTLSLPIPGSPNLGEMLPALPMIQRVLLFIVLSLVTAATSALPHSTQQSGRNLVPRLQASEDFEPKAFTTLQWPGITLSLSAQPNQPLLLLEDVKSHGGITCTTATNLGAHITMNLSFVNDDAFNAARNSWSNIGPFILLTLDTTCINPLETGVSLTDSEQNFQAWRVGSVQVSESATAEGAANTISLAVGAVSMQEAVQSIRVQYQNRINDTNTWETSSGRDELETTDSQGLSPLAPNALSTPSPQDIVVSTRSHDTYNASISLDFTLDLANSSDLSHALTHGVLNYTLERRAPPGSGSTLEIATNNTQPGSRKMAYAAPSKPLCPTFKIPGLFEFSSVISAQLNIDIQSSTPVNFTYEIPHKMTKDMHISVNLANASAYFNASTGPSGSNSTDDALSRVRINGGHPNLSTTMSFSTFTDLHFKILDVPNILRIAHDNSTLSLSATPHSSVTRQCGEPGPDDFETLATAYSVNASVQSTAEAEARLSQGVTNSSSARATVWSHTLRNETYRPINNDDDSSCFVLSTEYPSTFIPATDATPTWNIPGIETFYLTHGSLPTNVNYRQLAESTTVPDSLRDAVSSAAVKEGAVHVLASSKEGTGKKFNYKALIVGVVAIGIAFGVVPGWIGASCGFSWCPCSCCDTSSDSNDCCCC